jgi:hypothetical protein
MAQCLHIRLTANVLATTPGPLNPELLKYLNDCLHHKQYVQHARVHASAFDFELSFLFRFSTVC